MTKTPKFNTWMRSMLRRAFYRSGTRDQVFKKLRVGRNQYKCQGCGKVFKYKEIKIDHIIPVIDPLQGFENWDEYITRMAFFEPEKLQGLCDLCHDKKTAGERDVAVERRRKEKGA